MTGPALRADCRLSNYVYLGGASWCRRHPINACPFGVATYPPRLPSRWRETRRHFTTGLKQRVRENRN